MECCRTSSHDVAVSIETPVELCHETHIGNDLPSSINGQLLVVVRAIEQAVLKELRHVRSSQEDVGQRQAKLEQSLEDWMSRLSVQQEIVLQEVGSFRKGLTTKWQSTKLHRAASNKENWFSGTSSQTSGSEIPKVSASPIPTTPLPDLVGMHESSGQDSQDPKQLQDVFNKHSSDRISLVTIDDRTAIQKLVSSQTFDTFFAAIILANALCIGGEIEYKTVHSNTSAFFKVMSITFAFFFTVELFLRLAGDGVAYYFSPRNTNFVWNCFDAMMVVISLVEVIDIAVLGDEVSVGGTKSFLRLIRFSRLMRIIRVLRFSPQMRVMLFMIFESIRSLSYLLCLLGSILYVFAVLFTMAATEYLGVPGDPSYTNQSKSAEVQNFYGTIARSLYTCFKSITSGQSWGEVMDPLVEISPFYVCVFLFYIAFSVFALLNIFTGVFVEGSLAKAQNDRDLVVEKELQQKKACITNLQQLFEEGDTDGSGAISMKEFKVHLRHEKVQAYLSALNIDTSDIEELFRSLDRDGSGAIEINEFVNNLMHLMRGQSVEQYVSKLMKENKQLQANLFRFMQFVQDELHHIKAWVERREKWFEKMKA